MSEVAAKIRLTRGARKDYALIVAETTATGFGDLMFLGGRPPQGGIFSSVVSSHTHFTGGPWWGCAHAHAGFLERRFANLAMCLPTSFGDERQALKF